MAGSLAYAERGATALLVRDVGASPGAVPEWDRDDCMADGLGEGDLIFGDEDTAV